jgi:2-polyprenyl-3-methyl-5-hydroxy-6-metoxy-1,4-benzoquinol methylase
MKNRDGHYSASSRWSDISRDPNSPEVLLFRRNALAQTRHWTLIDNRTAYLCALASGKNVLDIGIVEHMLESSKTDEWLHKHISKASKDCLGIDILAKEIEVLRDRGYNVLAHDITTGPLDRKFELIVVGDVIEHLDNPSALFRNVAQMLAPTGRLVVSTPNPWYGNAIIKNVFDGKPFTDSADHVAWFDAGTLCEMASRNGLLLERYAGVREGRSSSFLSSLFFTIAPLLMYCGIRREIFAKTMIYEFVLPNATERHA